MCLNKAKGREAITRKGKEVITKEKYITENFQIKENRRPFWSF